MRWPIRNQIFVPFAALVLVAVAAIAVTMAALAAHRSGEERVAQMQRVEATLADASFPFTANVLQKMRGLSGADFVALDSRRAIVSSTFVPPLKAADLPSSLPAVGPPKRLDELEVVEVARVPYFAAVLPGNGTAGVSSLLILYPQENLRRARWEAAWPPLAIGGLTILVMVTLSAWLSGRLARRIEAVRALFSRIADGHFVHADAQPPRDEIYDLILSANRLSDQLDRMQDQVSRTERLRLLAQLAGGIAHQLRNAVTGARMAVQLHQRRCVGPERDESLDVALRQLTLTEQHVRGLLSLGKPEPGIPSPGRLSAIMADIEKLVRPAAQHAHVDWECEPLEEKADVLLTNADSLRAGLLNVVLNALEAAGTGGRVRLWAERGRSEVCVHIADSGHGPPESLEATMFEPFVTSKPEGVGLGLALAQRAAQEHGGSVAWSRVDGETVFTMSLAVGSPERGDLERHPRRSAPMSVPVSPDVSLDAPLTPRPSLMRLT